MNVKTSNVPVDLLDVTRLAVQFFTDNYLKKRTKSRYLTCTVAFRSEKTIGSDALAVTSAEEDGNRLPCDFLIEFSNKYRDIPIREYLITLFHELVHVKQYAEGRLKLRHKYNVWEKQAYHFDHEDEDLYWDLPWEREAMSIEHGAYSKFSRKHAELGLESYRPSYLGRSLSEWKRTPIKSTT